MLVFFCIHNYTYNYTYKLLIKLTHCLNRNKHVPNIINNSTYTNMYLRDRPFNLQGGGFVCPEFFFGQHEC